MLCLRRACSSRFFQDRRATCTGTQQKQWPQLVPSVWLRSVRAGMTNDRIISLIPASLGHCQAWGGRAGRIRRQADTQLPRSISAPFSPRNGHGNRSFVTITREKKKGCIASEVIPSEPSFLSIIHNRGYQRGTQSLKRAPDCSAPSRQLR